MKVRRGPKLQLRRWCWCKTRGGGTVEFALWRLTRACSVCMCDTTSTPTTRAQRSRIMVSFARFGRVSIFIPRPVSTVGRAVIFRRASSSAFECELPVIIRPVFHHGRIGDQAEGYSTGITAIVAAASTCGACSLPLSRILSVLSVAEPVFNLPPLSHHCACNPALELRNIAVSAIDLAELFAGRA